MANRKYVLELKLWERRDLERITSTGRSAACKISRAHILLKTDRGEHGPAWTDARIAEALSVSERTVENVRKRAVEEGPMAALERKPRERPPVDPKLDGEGEARLTALACSTPPEGCARWSLRLLADKMVELEVVEAVSHETVRRTLKKTRSSHGASGCGASRPDIAPALSRPWSGC